MRPNPIHQEQYDGVTNIQNVIGLTNGTNHLEGDTNANRLFGGSVPTSSMATAAPTT